MKNKSSPRTRLTALGKREAISKPDRFTAFYWLYNILLILKDGQNAVLLNTTLIPLLLLKLQIRDLIEEITFVFQISLTYEK